MEKKHYITINPDLSVVYSDERGHCSDASDDSIDNNDFTMGTVFQMVVPGISEWMRQYENATDFAETETDSSFDWRQWHAQGILFAKYISEHLPGDYFLNYRPAFEDRSHLVREFYVIPENLAFMLNRFPLLESDEKIEPSYKHNVSLELDGMLPTTIKFKLGNSIASIILRKIDEVRWMKNWLERIVRDEEEVISIHLSTGEYYDDILFFPQRIGLHKDMGQFWIKNRTGDSIPKFNAYVNKREFVRALYLSIMTHFGFCIYNVRFRDGDKYPEGEEREKVWEPYNAMKSSIVEWYISDELYKNSPMPLFDRIHNVSETFVMFPEYGMVALWDTMGVGCGDHEHLYSDYDEFKYHIPDFEEWLSEYDRSYKEEIWDFSSYWMRGWNIAIELRKILPDYIDLYYMSYDPSKPDEIEDYYCQHPRIIVPRIV